MAPEPEPEPRPASDKEVMPAECICMVGALEGDGEGAWSDPTSSSSSSVEPSSRLLLREPEDNDGDREAPLPGWRFTLARLFWNQIWMRRVDMPSWSANCCLTCWLGIFSVSNICSSICSCSGFVRCLFFLLANKSEEVDEIMEGMMVDVVTAWGEVIVVTIGLKVMKAASDVVFDPDPAPDTAPPT